MNNIEQFCGHKIIDVRAYGTDEYDFTCNLCGFGFSVGEYGFAEFIFDNGVLYFSVEGLGCEKPQRENVQELSADIPRSDMAGLVLEKIEYREEDQETVLYFQESKPICCRFEPNEGYCDRDYLDVEIDNWAAYDD